MRRRGKEVGHEVQLKALSMRGFQVEKKKMNYFLAPGLIPKKAETTMDVEDFGLYNSDEEIAGKEPDAVTYGKVERFKQQAIKI
jgi:hypothetical protein